MPRLKPPQTRPYRCECWILGIVDAARQGLFRGNGSASHLKSFTPDILGEARGISFIPARSKIQGMSGEVELLLPFEQIVKVEATATKIRRLNWSWICWSCFRKVRCMYRPIEPEFSPWGCRFCWTVDFRIPTHKALEEQGDWLSLRETEMKAARYAEELTRLKRADNAALVAAGFEPRFPEVG